LEIYATQAKLYLKSYKKYAETREKLLEDANASIDEFQDKYQNLMSILRKIKGVKVENTSKLARL